MACKEKDPYIEMIMANELPRLPHLQLINHCNFLQKALGSALNLLEILCMLKPDIEEEHKGRKRQQEEASTILAKTTQELMVAQQQIEDTRAPPKKGKWGDNARKIKEITNERDAWRTKYLTANATHAKGKMKKNLDKCHSLVKSLEGRQAATSSVKEPRTQESK